MSSISTAPPRRSTNQSPNLLPTTTRNEPTRSQRQSWSSRLKSRLGSSISRSIQAGLRERPPLLSVIARDRDRLELVRDHPNQPSPGCLSSSTQLACEAPLPVGNRPFRSRSRSPKEE